MFCRSKISCHRLVVWTDVPLKVENPFNQQMANPVCMLQFLSATKHHFKYCIADTKKFMLYSSTPPWPLFFHLRWASLQHQYQKLNVRLMQSMSSFQRWHLICFQSNTVFIKQIIAYYYRLYTHKIWKRSVEKYQSYWTLSKTTHFLSVICEVHVVQQCTEAQAGMVPEGLKTTSKIIQKESQKRGNPCGRGSLTLNYKRTDFRKHGLERERGMVSLHKFQCTFTT